VPEVNKAIDKKILNLPLHKTKHPINRVTNGNTLTRKLAEYGKKLSELI
jgi:hypothetical protein